MNDLKKISELDKQGKIDLLSAIQGGEVKPEEITSDTIVVSETKLVFTGYMANAASRKTGRRPRVLFVGDAKKLMDQTVENLKNRKT